MKRVALIGAGPLGLNVAGLIARLRDYDLIGFIDDKEGPIAGVDVLGDDSVLHDLMREGVRDLVVCIGSPERRMAIGRDVRERGFELPAVIHPAAEMGIGVRVGAGSIILPGAVILPEAEIGDFCVVEAGSFIGHHTRLGAGSLIGARAVVGNRATLDHSVMIGMGANVKSGSHLAAGMRVADFQLWE
jgi:UDP-3-O-[3-hydroxymyristoyl] glucosamine N-acyltransferase